jgi:hypothetical protein
MALALIFPFILPALYSTNTNSPYAAMIFFALIPSYGLGFVLYGYLDKFMDQCCGGQAKMKRRIKDQEEGLFIE